MNINTQQYVVVHATTVETYLNIHMLRTTIEIRRQIIDIQHPMYDITVRASASVGYDKKCMYILTIYYKII